MFLRNIWRKCMRGNIPGLERRKYVRLDLPVSIKYAVINRDKQAIFQPAEYTASTKNIGAGGLMIEVPLLVDEFMMTKSLLKVEVDLPDEAAQIHAVARIVFAKRSDTEDCYHLGLSFIEIDEQDRKRIVDFAKKKMKK